MAPDQVPPNNFPNTLANCAIRQYARGMTTTPEARPVTTVEALDALPDGTACVDAYGDLVQKRSRVWYSIGSLFPVSSAKLAESGRSFAAVWVPQA